MKEYIKYIPMALFCIFATKGLLTDSTIYNVYILGILGLYAAWYEFKTVGKYQDEVTKRFTNVDEHITQLYKNDKELTTQIQTLKIPSQFKGINNVR